MYTSLRFEIIKESKLTNAERKKSCVSMITLGFGGMIRGKSDYVCYVELGDQVFGVCLLTGYVVAKWSKGISDEAAFSSNITLEEQKFGDMKLPKINFTINSAHATRATKDDIETLDSAIGRTIKSYFNYQKSMNQGDIYDQ